jgi:hypothetical protein
MAERCSARRERLSTRLRPRGAGCGRSHECVDARRSALTRIILAPPRQRKLTRVTNMCIYFLDQEHVSYTMRYILHSTKLYFSQ